MILLLPAVDGWVLAECCPCADDAASAGSAPAGPAGSGESSGDHGNAAGPDDACSCAFCQLTLGNDPEWFLERPGRSHEVVVAASRDLSSFFLSEIYRPPLA